MLRVFDKSSNWIFIIPVTGIDIGKDIKGEFKVDDVTFFSPQKIPRIRNRLGIPTQLSKLKTWKKIKEYIENSQALAVYHHSGVELEGEQVAKEKVQNELDILSLSKLFYLPDFYDVKLKMSGDEQKTNLVKKIVIDKNDGYSAVGWEGNNNFPPFSLDKKWVRFHNKFFFFKLLNKIRQKKISRQWSATIKRAAILGGQSINSNDYKTSFLWNIIALEMLLTTGKDDTKEALVERLYFFLGWSQTWLDVDYAKRIREVYNNRSKFIHSGDTNSIDIKDLTFSKILLFNTFYNLLRMSPFPKNKKALIDKIEKFRAKEFLGYSATKCQNSFYFFSPHGFLK